MREVWDFPLSQVSSQNIRKGGAREAASVLLPIDFSLCYSAVILFLADYRFFASKG